MDNLDVATRPLARASELLVRSLAGPNPAANTPDASGRIAGFRAIQCARSKGQPISCSDTRCSR